MKKHIILLISALFGTLALFAIGLSVTGSFTNESEETVTQLSEDEVKAYHQEEYDRLLHHSRMNNLEIVEKEFFIYEFSGTNTRHLRLYGTLSDGNSYLRSLELQDTINLNTCLPTHLHLVLDTTLMSDIDHTCSRSSVPFLLI
ncbi:MAG: hypothetical protein LAT84_11775 [Balneolia bacterium]|nr:hypothetical protein [Balneolia bacterium]